MIKFELAQATGLNHALDFGDYHKGLATLLRKRYGTKPFDLKTLKAARAAIRKLKKKELSAGSYASEGEYCALGAFATNTGMSEGDYEVVPGSDNVRKYLIEAKHYDPRTVDALEAVNQFGSTAWDVATDSEIDPSKLESDKDRYKRVLAWIGKQIERAQAR